MTMTMTMTMPTRPSARWQGPSSCDVMCANQSDKGMAQHWHGIERYRIEWNGMEWATMERHGTVTEPYCTFSILLPYIVMLYCQCRTVAFHLLSFCHTVAMLLVPRFHPFARLMALPPCYHTIRATLLPFCQCNAVAILSVPCYLLSLALPVRRRIQSAQCLGYLLTPPRCAIDMA